MTQRIWSKSDAALLIGLCVIASLLSFGLLDEESSSSPPSAVQRYLKANASDRVAYRRRRRRQRRAVAIQQAEAAASATATDIYPWAETRLQPLNETPNPAKEVPLFWHIPKCGGTTAEDIYQCLGQALSNRVGSLPQFGHDQDAELLAFHPWPNNSATYVNTDTVTKAGILRAEEMGLVPSGLVDVIFTSEPSFAVEHLYDEEHKGRMLGLFRHPVERLVSKFYYLQVAKWERTYSPNWKNLSVLEWASRNNDNNNMVKKLAGKRMSEQVDEKDLQIAMRTIQQSFIVGLLDHMEESIHRFNIVIGIDELDKQNEECMNKFFGDGVEKKNSNSHPKLEEGDPAWAVIAERNDLDVRLYHHIVQTFHEQKVIIESYRSSMALGKE